MTTSEIADGTVHKMPADLRKALLSNKEALAKWQSLTPLARNEWICWTINVKLDKTRSEHVARVISELNEGMRRPCCWIGCMHRTDKPMNATMKWMLEKQNKSAAKKVQTISK